MVFKEEFEFLNSDLWLKYTQESYMPLKDIGYRLGNLGIPERKFPEYKVRIQALRKMGAVPFFLKSIRKNFWYFPSDSIHKKLHEIEELGKELYNKIESHGTFKGDFLQNAAVEEAITSAIYEGASSTRSEAKALIASNKAPKNEHEWMLFNNYKAMKWIKENNTVAISSDVILRIHEIVSQGALEEDGVDFSGKFRNDVVYVTSLTETVHEGVHHAKLKEALEEAIALTINHPRYLHPLVKAILLHYFIAYIHPFFDGNGRTARTLFYFQAMKDKLDFVELLSISASLKDYGKRYEKSFILVQKHDLDMSYFIDFCLTSLIQALRRVEKKVEYLIDIANVKELLKINSNQVALLQRTALNKHRSITIESYGESIGKSREVARRDLKDLFEKGFLKEESIGRKFVYRIVSKTLKNKVREVKLGRL